MPYCSHGGVGVVRGGEAGGGRGRAVLVGQGSPSGRGPSLLLGVPRPPTGAACGWGPLPLGPPSVLLVLRAQAPSTHPVMPHGVHRRWPQQQRGETCEARPLERGTWHDGTVGKVLAVCDGQAGWGGLRRQEKGKQVAEVTTAWKARLAR